MKQRFIFLLAIFFSLGGAPLKALKADDVVFKASAPESVAMGEQFRLTYTINTEAMEFRAPDLNDFQVLIGPSTSTNRNIQIGSTTTSVYSLTFTYMLMPKQEGTFNLPPATIKVKNSTYTSNALVIKVLPPNSQPSGEQRQASTGNISNDDLFVRMTISNRNMYEQESFLVTFKIYAAGGVNVAGVPGMKFPDFEGFLAQDIDLGQSQWKLENYNGRNYQTAVLKQSILLPQRAGKITIGSGRFEAVVRIRMQQRARSFFEDFLDLYQDINKELVTQPVTIDVKPLPSGKPSSFSGAVGNYSMKTTINSEHIKANEVVTIKVALSGAGNIRVAKNPEVVFPNDFDIYDPKIDTKITTTTGGTSGTKTIEYIAIPRFGGDFEIPAVKFSYFDPQSGTYKTLSSEPFNLKVDKGEGGDGAASPVVSNFSNQQRLNLLGEDIRYIKLSNIHFTQHKDIFFGSTTCILLYAVIAFLFILCFIIYRKQVKENANIALVRTKKANRTAIRRLKTAEKLLKENKREAFYEEILRAIWGYLSDKLNIPLSVLTRDNVETELGKYGVDESLLNEYMDILNTCEFARYAPNQMSDAMEHLFRQTVDAISKMENTIKK
ncbi:MAG: BatD family protein [Tannerella sp.]|nr:BatD family protein [Tannerella sp.]